MLFRVFVTILFLAFSNLSNADTQIYELISVSDGDSLLVRNNNSKMRVRLIGIDAPERHDNQKARRDSDRSGLDVKTIETLGEKSAQYLGNLLKPGSKIKLVTDVTRTDKYGRLLAYAYSEDGTFINLKMIEDGYAHPYSIPPNVKYKSEFKDAARRAREKLLGLWKAQ